MVIVREFLSDNEGTRLLINGEIESIPCKRIREAFKVFLIRILLKQKNSRH